MMVAGAQRPATLLRIRRAVRTETQGRPHPVMGITGFVSVVRRQMGALAEILPSHRPIPMIRDSMEPIAIATA
jgi:hypothetical protein